MKRRMLMLAGVVCLNLSVVSSAVAGMPNFTLKAQGTEGCMGCMSARITICGQTYTVKEGTTIQCMGTTPVISNIPVKLQWGGIGNCGEVKEICSGSMNFTSASASGTICTVNNSREYSTLGYSITKTASTGAIDFWTISFNMNHYIPGSIL